MEKYKSVLQQLSTSFQKLRLDLIGFSIKTVFRSERQSECVHLLRFKKYSPACSFVRQQELSILFFNYKKL